MWVQDNLLVSELLETIYGHSAPIARVQRVGQRLSRKVQPLFMLLIDVTAAAFFCRTLNFEKALRTLILVKQFSSTPISLKLRDKQPKKNASTVVYLSRLIDQVVVVHLSRLPVLLQILH